MPQRCPERPSREHSTPRRAVLSGCPWPGRAGQSGSAVRGRMGRPETRSGPHEPTGGAQRPCARTAKLQDSPEQSQTPPRNATTPPPRPRTHRTTSSPRDKISPTTLTRITASTHAHVHPITNSTRHRGGHKPSHLSSPEPEGRSPTPAGATTSRPRTSPKHDPSERHSEHEQNHDQHTPTPDDQGRGNLEKRSICCETQIPFPETLRSCPPPLSPPSLQPPE